MSPEGRTGIDFEVRQVNLRPNHGRWRILTCHSEYETQLCDIVISSNPLGRFERSCTTPTVLQLELDAQLWLASETLGSIRISSDFYVSDDVRTLSQMVNFIFTVRAH